MLNANADPNKRQVITAEMIEELRRNYEFKEFLNMTTGKMTAIIDKALGQSAIVERVEHAERELDRFRDLFGRVGGLFSKAKG